MEVPPREGGFDGIAWLNRVLGTGADGDLLHKVEEAIELVEAEVLAEETRCQSTVVALETELEAHFQSNVIKKLEEEALQAKTRAVAALGPCTDAQANPEIATLAQIDAALHSLDNATKVLRNVRDWDAQVRDSERAIQFVTTTLETIMQPQDVSGCSAPFADYLTTIQKLAKTLGGLKNALAAIESLPGYTYRHNTVTKLIGKVTPLIHRGAAMTLIIHLRTWDYKMLADSVKAHISLISMLHGKQGVCLLSEVLISAVCYQVIPDLWRMSADCVADIQRHQCIGFSKVDDLRIPSATWATRLVLFEPLKEGKETFGKLVGDSLEVLTPTLDTIRNEFGRHLCTELQNQTPEHFSESDGRLLVSLFISLKTAYVEAFIQSAYVSAARLSLAQLLDPEVWQALLDVRIKLVKLESELLQCCSRHMTTTLAPHVPLVPDIHCAPDPTKPDLPYLVFDVSKPTSNFKPLDALVAKVACAHLRNELLDVIDLGRDKISQCLADRTSYNPGLTCVNHVEKEFEKLAERMTVSLRLMLQDMLLPLYPIVLPALLGTLGIVYAEVVEKTHSNFFTVFKAQVEAQRSHNTTQGTGLLQSSLEALFLVLNIRYKYGIPGLTDAATQVTELSRMIDASYPSASDLMGLLPSASLPLGVKAQGGELRVKMNGIITFLTTSLGPLREEEVMGFAETLMPYMQTLLMEARELVVTVSTYDIQIEFQKLGPLWSTLQDLRLESAWIATFQSLAEKHSSPSDVVAALASNTDFALLSGEPTGPAKSFSTKCVNLLGSLFSFPEQSNPELRLRKSWDIENMVLPGILYACTRLFLSELERIQINTVTLAFRVAVDIGFIISHVKSLGSHILFRQDNISEGDEEGAEIAANLVSAVCELKAVLELLCVRVASAVPDLTSVVKVADVFEDPDFEKLEARINMGTMRTLWMKCVAGEKQNTAVF